MHQESFLLFMDGCPPRGHGSAAVRMVVCILAVAVLCLSAPVTGRAAPVGGNVALSALPPGTSQPAAPDPLPVAEPASATNSEAPGTAGPYRVYLPAVLRTTQPQVREKLFGVEVLRRGASYVDWVADAGGGWTRIKLFWSRIEPQNTTPDRYQWPAYLDQMLAQASARNVTVVLDHADNPAWASSLTNGPIDLVDISEFTQFIRAAVTRYSAPPYNVKYWEFYNEPDNGSEKWAVNSGFGQFGYYPQAYVDILAAAYQPIKKIDPAAQIVFGGLAYDFWEEEDGGPFVRGFLDQVLRRGGGAYFDVMNFHYYPAAFAPRWEELSGGLPGLIGKTNYIRDRLASHGVHKPIICSETSWESKPDQGGDEGQTRAVHQLTLQGIAAGLQSTIWFVLVDDPAYWKSGLLDTKLAPKPSFTAYQTLASQLGSARYDRTLSAAETGSDQVAAFQFTAADGTTRIIGAWTRDDRNHPLVIQASSVIVVDKMGKQSTVYDGQDGRQDGRVTVTLGGSPVYLRFQP
jgi:hypothetical protein